MSSSIRLRLRPAGSLVLCALLACLAGCAESGAKDPPAKRNLAQRTLKDAFPGLSPPPHRLGSRNEAVPELSPTPDRLGSRDTEKLAPEISSDEVIEDIQGLKKDATVLVANWPTTSGVLPYLGRYRIHDNEADCLSIDPPADDFCTVGWHRDVIRTPDGSLVFDYLDDKIEYHPNGGKPASYEQSFWTNGREILRVRFYAPRYVELEPNWYFVTYSHNWVQDWKPE